MAIKIFTLLRKAPDQESGQFDQFVRNEFVPKLRETGTGAQAIAAVFNRIEEMNYREGAMCNVDGHDWSVILETYFPDETSATAAVQDCLIPLIDNAADKIAESANVIVRELIMYDRPNDIDAVKVFGFFRIVFDMTRRQVFDHWYGPHADLGREMNAFQAFLKYSQNHTLEEYHERNSRFDYDGASIVFFDSYPTAASIYRNPEIMGPMEVDERNMGTEPGAVVSIAARETLLFGTMP